MALFNNVIAKDLILKLCAYAEEPVVQKLLDRGLYLKLLNYFLVEFSMARKWSWSFGYPYWLTIDPTNFCQLQCPFCPTGNGRGVRSKASMNLVHFKKFIDRVGKYVIHADFMNWGEPVLNRNLPEMIAWAKKYDIDVKIDCNFNDISESMVDLLILSGLDLISLSIDGASQETYRRYRIGGEFERVISNAKLLVRRRRELDKKKPKILWQFLVFKHNEHEIEKAKKMAGEIGVDQICFNSAFMTNEPRVLKAWLPENKEYQLYSPPSDFVQAVPQEQTIKIQPALSLKTFRTRRFSLSQLYEPAYLWRILWNTKGDRMPRFKRAKEAFMYSWKTQEAPKAQSVPFGKSPDQPICKWPWAGLTVNPNGSVSPCCTVEDEQDDFGQVFGKAFFSFWNGKNYRRSRRHVGKYIDGKAGIKLNSDHVCERCRMIGHVNFRFPSKLYGEESVKKEGKFLRV